MTRVVKSHEGQMLDLIQSVKYVGEYLQKHAEDIVYTEPYLAQDGLNIRLYINDEEISTIEVTQNILVTKRR
ncbi:MAG: hypothetical protein ACOYJH_02950 [Anaerovoracaceae bacterium]